MEVFARMALVLGMRRVVLLVLVLGVFVMPQVPKVLALRMLSDMLEVIALAMMPLLVGRLLVCVAMSRAAPQFVRMTHPRDIAAYLVTPMNNSHKAPPPTSRL
jgi:hypothetical protein